MTIWNIKLQRNNLLFSNLIDLVVLLWFIILTVTSVQCSRRPLVSTRAWLCQAALLFHLGLGHAQISLRVHVSAPPRKGGPRDQFRRIVF